MIDVTQLPVEGYYTETEELREYFLTVKTLQSLPLNLRKDAQKLDAYARLAQVMSSAIYGAGTADGFFTQRLDPLYLALMSTSPDEWSVVALTEKACVIANETDDISLVGIAAYLKDPVIIAALRESVALYGAVAVGCAMPLAPKIKYEWDVSLVVEQKVNRFIKLFNELTSKNIPLASADDVKLFYDAFEDNGIYGRCIYIGQDDRSNPSKKYHWAINVEHNVAVVDEFWSEELWTTEHYLDKRYST